MLAKITRKLSSGELIGDLRRGFMNSVASSTLVPKRLRVLLLRACGIKIGRDTLILAGIRFVGQDVVFEDGVGVNSGCVFDRGANIHLEKNVRAAYNVIFACAGHPIGPPEERCSSDWFAGPIRVGAGTWIGANCILLPGVTIAPGCVVATGSCVKSSLEEPNAIYAGNPAKFIRKIDDGPRDS